MWKRIYRRTAAAIRAAHPSAPHLHWTFDEVKEVDREVEVSLRQTVKRSLQELSRAINGDAKSEPQTLFGVKIVLENSRIDYRPTMINLTHVVNIVAKELISTVAVVPRLREVLVPETDRPAVHTTTDDDEGVIRSERHPSFYSVISNDEDMLKIVVQIMNGMSSTATELQKYLGCAISRSGGTFVNYCCPLATGRSTSPYGRWTKKPTSGVMQRRIEV